MMHKILLHFRYSRYKLLLLIIASSMIAFFLQRLFLYLKTWPSYDACTIDQILTAFARGIHFDLVATTMLAAPLSLLFLIVPPIFDRHPAFRLFVSILAGAISSLVLLVCVADFFFFLEFGARLDIKVIQYFHYDYIHKILVQEFHLVPILAVCLLVLAGMTLIFYKKIFPRPDRPNAWPANLVCFLLISAALAVSIRGTIGPKPINSGPAYFSPSNRLAQLTLNSLFTLREATYSHLARGRDVEKLYQLLPKERAFRITREMIKTNQHRFLNREDNPLDRITDTGREQKDYNVVVVIMESVSWPYIGMMGGMPKLTPNLDRLIRNGILMENCFSVGTRSTRAFSGVVAGFPDLPGESIITRETSVGNIRTIGSILEKRGYKTMFIYAGQPYYDHRQSFLGSNGFNDFVFEEEFPQKTFRTHLGWCDEDLFMAAHKAFTEQDGPFLGVLLTLSFHRDYNIAEGKIDPAYPDHPYAKQLETIQYMDWAIGQFMEKARQSEYFENTLFVFTADHCGGFLSMEPEPTAQRIPFLIYAPDIIGTDGQRINQICSQTDIPPTIMELLGGAYRHSFFGSSVLSRPPGKAGALLQDGHGILSYIDNRHYMVRVIPHQKEADLYKFHSPAKLTPLKTSPKNKQIRAELKNRCIAMIQTAAFVYNKQAYQFAKDR